MSLPQLYTLPMLAVDVSAEPVAVAGAVLLILCLLVGLLAGVLTLVEDRRLERGARITVNAWLALAWLATLTIPPLAVLLIAIAYYLVGRASDETYRLAQPAEAGAAVAVILGAFGLTMGTIAWLTRRNVVQPLAAMDVAARRVAAGDLDFRIPASQLREVANVAEAFGAMGDALRVSIHEQSELERQRRLFIGAVAHDLRTPLFLLRGHLEGLEQGLANSPEKAARYLAVCRLQADAVDRLVGDLFAYSRLEQLDMTPHHEPLDLALLLCTAAESFRARADERRVMLATNDARHGCVVSGDPDLLARAIENVLDNALRHTPTDGRIEVACTATPAGSRFVIADSGPGFAPADLPYVFDPLYRGEASRNRATGGAGLGLAVARGILRAHGGEMTAANREAGGALVVATLPALLLPVL